MDLAQEPMLPPHHEHTLLLANHHHRIETRCRSFSTTAWTDARELAIRWADLEAELRDHVAAEEDIILPSYARHAPEDAKWILDDHARILGLLVPIGSDLEFPTVRETRLQLLIEALAAHAAREEAEMYPWAIENLVLVTQRLLYAEVSRWIARC